MELFRTPVESILRNVAHFPEGKLPETVRGFDFIQKPLVYFNIKASSKTDLIFAMLFDLARATRSANTWLPDERRLVRWTLQKETQYKAGSDARHGRTGQNYAGQQQGWTAGAQSLHDRGVRWSPRGTVCEDESLWNHLWSWYHFGQSRYHRRATVCPKNMCKGSIRWGLWGAWVSWTSKIPPFPTHRTCWCV